MVLFLSQWLMVELCVESEIWVALDKVAMAF